LIELHDQSTNSIRYKILIKMDEALYTASLLLVYLFQAKYDTPLD
jgi:hypothetical protein